MNQDVFLSTNFHELALMFFFSTYLGYLHGFLVKSQRSLVIYFTDL